MKINTPRDLSAVLRESRKSKGWTQAELAKRIGVYQRDISNYETKTEKISVDMLLKLCAMLDIALCIDKPFKNNALTQNKSLPKKQLMF